MKFSIVTPCYNAARYIGATIDAILMQTALKQPGVTLQYIIVDGESTDETLTIAHERCTDLPANVTVEIISEADRGMYDALWKGLQRCDGDVCAYLNAGDLYHPAAFAIIQSVLHAQGQVQWLTGMQITHNQHGHVVSAALPFRYRSRLFAQGLYNRRRPLYLQQESTFWRTSLNQHINGDTLRKFKLAGDAYLWATFSKHATLSIVGAHLGGFRVHPGQQSEALSDYRQELNQIATAPNPLNWLQLGLDALLWYAPQTIKKRVNPNQILLYNHSADTWQ